MKKFLGIAAFVALWQAAAMLLRNPILPSPVDVCISLTQNYRALLSHSLYSLYRLAAGTALAVVLGMPLGILLGYNKKCGEIISPLIYVLAPLPKIAFLPLIMLIFGIGNLSKVFIIFIIMLFQIVISAHDSVKTIPEEYFAPYLAAKAGHGRMLRHIVVPAALPGLFTALRVGLATGISVLFFAENFGTNYGIGYYTMDMWMRMDYRQMYLGILALGVIGLASVWLTGVAERRVCKWRF